MVNQAGPIDNLKIFVTPDPSTEPDPTTGRWTWEGKTYQLPRCPLCGQFLVKDALITGCVDKFGRVEDGSFRLTRTIKLSNPAPGCHHRWWLAETLWFNERWMFPGIDVDIKEGDE